MASFSEIQPFPGTLRRRQHTLRYEVLPDEVDLLRIVSKHLSFVRISFAFGFQVFPAFASWHTNTTRPNEHTTNYHTIPYTRTQHALIDVREVKYEMQ